MMYLFVSRCILWARVPSGDQNLAMPLHYTVLFVRHVNVSVNVGYHDTAHQ